MGTLIYGVGEARVRIDDDQLAHVKTIALMKLRRNESFALTIRCDASEVGRDTLWLHPSIPLQFRFDTNERNAVDRALLESLMHEANSGELTIHTATPAT